MMIANKQFSWQEERDHQKVWSKSHQPLQQSTQVDKITWKSAQQDANVHGNEWSCIQHFTTNATATTLVQRNCSHHTFQEQKHPTNMVKAITTNISASNKKRPWACIQQRRHEMVKKQTYATIVKDDSDKWVLTIMQHDMVKIHTHEQTLPKTKQQQMHAKNA